MSDARDRLVQLERENARLRAGLEIIELYARNASFGGWRHDVTAMAVRAQKATGQP